MSRMSNTTGRVSVAAAVDLGTNDRKHRLGPDPDAARAASSPRMIWLAVRLSWSVIGPSSHGCARAPRARRCWRCRMKTISTKRGAPRAGDGLGQRQVIRRVDEHRDAGDAVEQVERRAGRVEDAESQIKSGAVSPAARAIARIAPVTIPPIAAGRITREYGAPAVHAERVGGLAQAAGDQQQHLLAGPRDQRKHHDRQRDRAGEARLLDAAGSRSARKRTARPRSSGGPASCRARA